ncbi:hypothetical protein B1812_07655 [Methylocystis bryophila]|uniref:Uncharacterized protein n=1 Tax=Methylocystis bryophila TaxID=655015 RepID=A0A1W6N0Y7_9HYPH|nr:hypothetical protein B1812_07655 [Methylocystis bryophila]
MFGAPATDDPSSGFNHCVAPRPPDCVDAPATSYPTDECERRVRSYVANVFRYRECLGAETQRQVRRANDTLDKWKRRQSYERR